MILPDFFLIDKFHVQGHSQSTAVTVRVSPPRTVGMLVYPYLAHSILGSSQAIGTFLGLAIHDTSQVVSCLSFRPVLFLLHLFFCFSSFFIIFFIFVVHNRSLSIYLFFSHLLILKDGRSIDVQRSVS